MPKIRCSYQLHIQLCDTKPNIWRRIIIADNTSFSQLHCIIQAVMGWENCHSYFFELAGQRYGIPNPDQPEDPTMDARRFTIGQLLHGQALTIRYLYGFNNAWQHRIRIENISPIGSPEALTSLPICLGGRNACPPENCGGSEAYIHLLDAQSKTSSNNHPEALLELSPTFKANYFDIKTAQHKINALKLFHKITTDKSLRPKTTQQSAHVH